MTTIDPPMLGGDLDRELGRIVLEVTDPEGDFSDPWARARVRTVIDAIAVEFLDDILGRLSERLELPDQEVLDRFRAGAPGSFHFLFVGVPIRFDRASAAIVATIKDRHSGEFTLSLPLASDLQLSEGSVKGAASLALGVILGVVGDSVILPGIADSKPATLGRKYVTEKVDAAWDARHDAGAITERALERLNIDASVKVDGDRVVIVLSRPRPAEPD